MKILILNWRDIKNPSSGGAEILTHEIAKRWVKQGHSVTQFSSEFPSSKSKEVIDGVTIIRKGHPDARYFFSSVHFQAFLHYIKNFRGTVDVVIDEIHGLPFFTPLFVKEKKIALICEVADDLWKKTYGPFFGSVGRFVEVFYLRVIYNNIHFLTISESTKENLLTNGVKEENIHVIPMGIKLPKINKTFPKEKIPTLIFVGRLSKPKGIEDAFFVLKKVKTRLPKTRLWVVGRGEDEYFNNLKDLVEELDLRDSVNFFGFVSEEKKFELMARAHVLIAPSIKEGFGLTIPEAGLVGTPSIGYNVFGLRDVLLNGENGLLVEPKIEEMGSAIVNLLKNKDSYQKMQEKSKERAERLSFEESCKVSLQFLKDHAVS